MKKVAVSVAIFLLVFFTVSCKQEILIQKPVDPDKRRQVASEWIKAAEEVAVETKDEEALELVKFLKQSKFIASPIASSDGERTMKALDEIPNTEFRIAIMPLYPEDAELGSEWKGEFEKGEYASFSRYTNNVGLVTLKNKFAMSERRKGIMLLHELKHMAIFLSGELREVEKENEQIAAAIDEYRIGEFEFRLTKKLGGKVYTDLLKKSTDSLVKRMRQKETIIFARPWFPRELENIFGKSDDQELMMREQTLWTASLMQAFDDVYGRDSKKGNVLKLRYYRQFYGYKYELPKNTI